MPKGARQGDAWTGQCCCHDGCIAMSGVITEGSPDTLVNGRPQARLDDEVVGDCGHTGYITSGSSNYIVNGLPAARVGDTVGGPCLSGNIITGSDNFEVN